MKNNTDNIKDFIGVFPNAASKEYCEKVIDHFRWIQTTRGYGPEGIVTRQANENNIPTSRKDSDMYFFEGEPNLIVLENSAELLQEYNEITWKCYEKFAEKYGFLRSLSLHKMSYSIKIQKYRPGQGYHVWHCDASSPPHCRRMVVSILYLNTVEKGGETEFLHQSMRVCPEQGTLALFPPYWTHPHRGNPPLEGDKYIMNSWLEYME